MFDLKVFTDEQAAGWHSKNEHFYFFSYIIYLTSADLNGYISCVVGLLDSGSCVYDIC